MLRPGQTIILCVLALLSLGVVVVTSAGLSIDPEQQITFQSLLTGRVALRAILALGALGLVALLPLDEILAKQRYAGLIILALMAICIGALLLVYVPALERVVNGSRRWVQLTPTLSFQPSEIAKWGLPVILAVYLARQGEGVRKFFSGLLPAVLMIGLLCGLIMLEDLGTAVLMGAAAVVVLIAARARWRHVVMLAMLGVPVCVLGVMTSTYRMNRITAFLDPFADPAGTGYHMIQSQAAIAAGGITGSGLGHGLHKFGYLPEDTTDFLFAIICEELGAAGALLVVALYAAVLIAGWSIVCREQRPALRLLGLGVLATLGLQAAMNMLVVTGLAPTKGIALPLLSWGGSGWIMGAAALGVLVRMDLRQAKAPSFTKSAPSAFCEDRQPQKSARGTFSGSLEAEARA
jgi:cell division protein FtsW